MYFEIFKKFHEWFDSVNQFYRCLGLALEVAETITISMSVTIRSWAEKTFGKFMGLLGQLLASVSLRFYDDSQSVEEVAMVVLSTSIDSKERSSKFLLSFMNHSEFRISKTRSNKLVYFVCADKGTGDVLTLQFYASCVSPAFVFPHFNRFSVFSLHHIDWAWVTVSACFPSSNYAWKNALDRASGDYFIICFIMEHEKANKVLLKMTLPGCVKAKDN